MIKGSLFYGNYFGHPTEDIKLLEQHFRDLGKRIIWIAGDSSFDNKHWVTTDGNVDAVNGYQHIIDNGKSLQDVCYWMNKELIGTQFVCINIAREEACVENIYLPLYMIQPSDIVILSIGGNDVILKPSTMTIISMLIANYLIPECLLSYFLWLPNPFKNIFYTETQRIVNHFRCLNKYVCTIYYPCEVQQYGWANGILSKLSMSKLQNAIRACFTEYHSKIEGVKAIPLFKALDKTSKEDYVSRVEPSARGGEKMAKFIIKHLNLLK